MLIANILLKEKYSKTGITPNNTTIHHIACSNQCGGKQKLKN